MPDYEKVLLTKTDSQDDICKAGLPSPDWQKVARVLAEKLTDAKCVGQVDKALCTGRRDCASCWLSWAVKEVERDH